MSKFTKKRPREDAPNGSKPPKPKKQFTEKDRARAGIFERLSDERRDTRLQAAKELLEEFSSEQDFEVEKLNDVINRLIRGLCSGRKAARAGYFVALSELLRQCCASERMFKLSLGDMAALLTKIESVSKPDPDLKQEARDKMIGRVSAYKALLQSSVLTGQTFSSKEDWDLFLEKVCLLALSKNWLREECGSMLCEYISSSKTLAEQESYVKDIFSKFSSHDLLKTSEGVALWLTAQTTYPDLKLPKDTWLKRSPLHTKERQTLTKILCDGQDSSNAIGTWKPQPHFAWRVVLQHAYIEFPSLSKFRQFWIETVDNTMFGDKASAERKFWGFHITAMAIATIPVSLISTLFTPNFMRCLVNQRLDSKRDVFTAAGQTLEHIVARGTKDSDATLILCETILATETSASFDTATQSKTLESLVCNAREAARVEVIEMISKTIREPRGPNVRKPETERLVLASMLSTILFRNTKQNQDQKLSRHAWISEVTGAFATYAYLTPKTADLQNVPAITEDSRNVFHDKLIAACNLLIPKLESPSEFLVHIVQDVYDKGFEGVAFALAIKADDAVLQAVKSAHKTLKKLQKSSKGQDSVESFSTLQILFSLVLLDVYSGDADGVDMLEELQTVYTSMTQNEAADASNDALVELLLSFLSKDSSLYRQIAELVFPTLASSMSENGLDSLLDIVSKKENMSGQEELFELADQDSEGDAVDGAEDGASDLEMDSDVEMISGTEDDGSEGSENSDEDEEGGVDDEELAQFNDLLAQTLKTSIPGSKGAVLGDDDESDGSDMDDEQMMELEPDLTRIFQERRKIAGLGALTKKKEKSKARLQMTLFKSRVLDLLQIYVKQEYASPLTFKIMVPLLVLIRETSSADLEKKAGKILQTWTEACERHKVFPSTASVDDLWILFREVHDEALTEASERHDGTCCRASLFLARILVSQDVGNIHRLVTEYGKTQIAWMERRGNVQPSFFTQWLGWCADWKKTNGAKLAEVTEDAEKEKNGEGKSSKKDKSSKESKKGKKAKSKK